LALALFHHRKLFPQHTLGFLDTDGAGAYAGVNLLSRLHFLLSDQTFRILEHSIGEPGGGKSSLDGGFGVDKRHVRDMIRLTNGGMSAKSAIELVVCLQNRADRGGRVITYLVIAKRDLPAIIPSAKKAFSAAKVKLRDSSLRKFESNGVVKFYPQSGLSYPRPTSSYNMNDFWHADVDRGDICPLAGERDEKHMPSGCVKTSGVSLSTYSSQVEKAEVNITKMMKRELKGIANCGKAAPAVAHGSRYPCTCKGVVVSACFYVRGTEIIMSKRGVKIVSVLVIP
jgi:hypothetical protein